MNLHLLYPCNPLRRSEPDELYVEEYASAVEQGFDVSLFSFEEFLAGIFRVRPSLPSGHTLLYRGWMLTPDQYKRLHSEIVLQGASPLTSPEQYERCHHLPNWYPLLQEFTPETHFFLEVDNIVPRLQELGWTRCFLKDYVKSLCIEGGSMVLDFTKVPEVIAKMKSYRGQIEGGLCARQIEDWDPATEERFFVFRGRAFSRNDVLPQVVRIAATRINSPFFAVDTINRRDGVVRIIELGDGQVSDRKKWSALQFLDALGK